MPWYMIMANRKDIIEALKSSLRSSGFTYAEIARQLKLSEISIKRSFSQRNFKLDRLEQICKLIDLELSDLLRLADEQETKISSLTIEQEQELINDTKFLLVAICVQNAWQLEEILENYNLTKPECIKYLIRLEAHGLIRLLPGNRVRRLLAQDFHWCVGGPIEKFYEQQVQREFFDASFSKPREMRHYLIGMLSNQSIKTMEKELLKLQKTFSDLQEEDSKVSVRFRKNVGLFLAFRPWELSTLSKLRIQKK